MTLTLAKAGQDDSHRGRRRSRRWSTQGYSLAFGARFLKRVIDEQIKLPISARWKEGSHFEVSVEDGAIVVAPTPATAHLGRRRRSRSATSV